MTDKQISFYSNKLAQLGDLSLLADEGSSYDEFASKIANELKDENRREFYKPYLLKLGFNM